MSGENDQHIGQRIVTYLIEEKSSIDDPVLAEWLAARESNRADFLKYQKMWKETRKLSEMKHFDASRAWEKVNKINNRKAGVRRRMQHAIYAAAGVAASVLLMVAVHLFDDSHALPESQPVEMRTEFGSRSEITLPDGSVVKLNAGSQIGYAYDHETGTRKVDFRGEGFFEIAKSDAPFVITVPGDMRVKVLGTVFNLSAYEDDSAVITTLLEGSVEMDHSSGEKLMLHPGQTGIYDKTTQTMAHSDANSAHAYGWLNNKLYMEDMSLAQVCKYLGRRFDVEIATEGIIGEKIQYTGVLQEETIIDVLDALCRLSRIKYRMKGKEITISPK